MINSKIVVFKPLGSQARIFRAAEGLQGHNIQSLRAHAPSLLLPLLCTLQDLLLWTRDKEEVEVVDLVLRLKDKLVSMPLGAVGTELLLTTTTLCQGCGQLGRAEGGGYGTNKLGRGGVGCATF